MHCIKRLRFNSAVSWIGLYGLRKHLHRVFQVLIGISDRDKSGIFHGNLSDRFCFGKISHQQIAYANHQLSKAFKASIHLQCQFARPIPAAREVFPL